MVEAASTVSDSLEDLPTLFFIDRMFHKIDGKLIARSRYVMQQHLERELSKDEIVHHINEDSLDDRIENLRVMSKSEHTKLHCGTRDYSSRSRRTSIEIKNSEIPADGCIVSKMVGKFGPYRYHVKRVGKKQTWTYLGKGGVGGTKHELVSGPVEEAEA